MEVDAVKADDPEEDDSTVLDLNPKKAKKKTDNVFMDFMALYTRASHTDKTKGRRGSSTSRARVTAIEVPKTASGSGQK